MIHGHSYFSNKVAPSLLSSAGGNSSESAAFPWTSILTCPDLPWTARIGIWHDQIMLQLYPSHTILYLWYTKSRIIHFQGWFQLNSTDITKEEVTWCRILRDCCEDIGFHLIWILQFPLKSLSLVKGDQWYFLHYIVSLKPSVGYTP